MEAQISAIKNGYITLMSVLVASAIIVSITLSILVISTNMTKTSISHQAAKYANVFAESCIDEALKQIRNSTSFTGSGNLSFNQGSCVYNVINTGGQNRLVNATGTSASAVSRFSVSVNALNPKIGIGSWQEVSGF